MRLVSGAIVIKLVSNDFEADTLHGESAQLLKEESDFHGLEFEKQFACVYKVIRDLRLGGFKFAI